MTIQLKNTHILEKRGIIFSLEEEAEVWARRAACREIRKMRKLGKPVEAKTVVRHFHMHEGLFERRTALKWAHER